MHLMYKKYQPDVYESGSLYEKWGNDSPEVFAREISATRGYCIDRNQRLQVPIIKGLRSTVPLRLFIKADGSYKNNGDKVYLKLKKVAVILTCMHEVESSSEYREGAPIRTFREAIEARIFLSMKRHFITQEDVDASKATAAIQGEWLSPD